MDRLLQRLRRVESLLSDAARLGPRGVYEREMAASCIEDALTEVVGLRVAAESEARATTSIPEGGERIA